MDKTKIHHYIKPKALQQILERNGSMLEIPLVLLDADGNDVAFFGSDLQSLNGDRPKELSPITVRGSHLGTLVGYETENYQNERLREVLGNVVENITDLIISELKLDSMSEELLHNYRVLNLFYNVSSALVNILNVRKVCHIILDRIVSTIGLSKASVLLLDGSRKYLSVVAHKGLPDDEVENTLFKVEDSVCFEAIEKAKPLFIQDIDHYPGLKKRSKGKYRSKSFISVPILKSSRQDSQEVLGVINVADKLSGEPFYSGDMKLIMALTSLAAMSIQNAQYFEEVERGKEEWESTFDAITDTVAILDTGYRLRRVNKAYNVQYGFSKTDLLDQICYKYLYKIDSPCIGCPVTRTLLTGEPSYAEKKIGKSIFRQWTYPIYDEKGRATSVVLYTRDVTNLKKLKEQLTQSERMASIGQIAAGMAHEIRNPLGSILTAVEVLSSQKGVNEENFSTLSEVLKVEAKRLNNIISEFLLYAAPHQPRLQKNHLNKVMEEVIRIIRTDSEKDGIKIEMHLDSMMETSLFDADKIKQVIWNIVLNGIQSMNRGGVLTVSTKWMGNGAAFSVRDEGVGIPQEDRSKIFDPFYTTKASGTGLGLSIVNRIIEDHRGKIEIQSRLGEGTEFIVSLSLGAENRVDFQDQKGP